MKGSWKEIDVLFFDLSGGAAEPVAAYRAAGSVKPLLNVESFGASSMAFVEESAESRTPGVDISWPGGTVAPSGRRRIQGVFPEQHAEAGHKKAAFLDDIEFAAKTPGFSLFGHFTAWYQGQTRAQSFDCRFDLGGAGTRQEPGIRWYFEAVARARQLPLAHGVA
jgi:hypothetical protein